MATLNVFRLNADYLNSGAPMIFMTSRKNSIKNTKMVNIKTKNISLHNVFFFMFKIILRFVTVKKFIFCFISSQET